MRDSYKHLLRSAFAAGALALVWSGCDSADPGPGTDQELITRVTLTLTPTGGAPVIATANNANGDDQWDAVDSLRLKAGTTYAGTIALRDVPNNTDITEEIEEEYESHQFFYTLTGNAGSTVTLTITDRETTYGGTRNNPVGLAFTVSTVSAPGATGGLRVRLGHFEGGASEKNGSAQGETDLDVTFPLRLTP